jgi:hypothetical protein
MKQNELRDAATWAKAKWKEIRIKESKSKKIKSNEIIKCKNKRRRNKMVFEWNN